MSSPTISDLHLFSDSEEDDMIIGPVTRPSEPGNNSLGSVLLAPVPGKTALDGGAGGAGGADGRAGGAAGVAGTNGSVDSKSAEEPLIKAKQAEKLAAEKLAAESRVKIKHWVKWAKAYAMLIEAEAITPLDAIPKDKYERKEIAKLGMGWVLKSDFKDSLALLGRLAANLDPAETRRLLAPIARTHRDAFEAAGVAPYEEGEYPPESYDDYLHKAHMMMKYNPITKELLERSPVVDDDTDEEDDD